MPKPHIKIRTHSQPAYSLIFAVLIMMVIMITSTTAITNTREKILLFQDLEGGAAARLASESAAEVGIQVLKQKNPGYEISEPSAFDDGESYGSYEVFSQGKENDTFAGNNTFIPIPSTGSAVPSAECSVLDPHEDVDHACNWNKIQLGESASIPLYSDDGFGAIRSPDDLGLTAWYLRVRTPCTNGSFEVDCAGGSRYVLDDGAGYADDASIIFWQLVGETATGTVGKVPDDKTNTDFFGSETRDSIKNTEIYESLINTPNSIAGLDNIVLEAGTSAPKYDEIYDFCVLPNLETLILKLDIVSDLIADTGSAVPYLEWQLVTDSIYPFADNKAIIVGKGYHTGAAGDYYFPFVVVRTTVGESSNIYTLSN